LFLDLREIDLPRRSLRLFALLRLRVQRLGRRGEMM
jgi:hypothetical protein